MLAPLLVLSPPAYRIIDLGVPAGAENADSLQAVAVNGKGEVLVKTDSRGYLWRKFRYFDLGPPAASSFTGDPGRAEPTALNDRSVVVGGQGGFGPIFSSGLDDVDAFIWRGARMENLGVGHTTLAKGINDLGDVVGGGNHRAFARLGGRVVWLPTLSHVKPSDPAGEMGDVNEAEAVAINDRRQILINATYGRMHPHPQEGLSIRPYLVDGRFPNSKPRALPLPKGFDCGTGLALNRRGTVLAIARRYGEGGEGHPYLVRSGRLTPLPFGGALNGNDEVAGGSPPSVWRAGRVTRLPAFPEWTLLTADGINDRGQICGTGLHEGKPRVYLITPVAR